MFFAGTKLFGAEGLDGVDGGGAARGQIAREERSGDEAEAGGGVGDWIDGAHLKKQGRHQAHNDDSYHEAAGYADGGERESVADKHTGEGLVLCAEGHAKADLACAVCDGIG